MKADIAGLQYLIREMIICVEEEYPYTVAVFKLRMCMKEDNTGPNYIKGDN